MLGVQLETVVVDGMNSFLIIEFFVVSVSYTHLTLPTKLEV